MADYRQIHTHIWKDSWFVDLEPDYKLLFIYLFSNERANLAGLYDLSPRVIAFETGVPLEAVKSALDYFEEAGKIQRDGSMIWVKHLLRYNAGNIESPRIQTHLRSVIASIPDCDMKRRWIAYYNEYVPAGYRMDTVSIPTRTEHEHEHEHEQELEHEEVGGVPPCDAAPEPPVAAPVSFQDWLKRIEASKNKSAELVSLFSALFPDKKPPDFAYMGKTARTVGGAGRLADLMWQVATRPPTGDVLAYCLAKAKGGNGNGSRPPARDVTADVQAVYTAFAATAWGRDGPARLPDPWLQSVADSLHPVMLGGLNETTVRSRIRDAWFAQKGSA